MRLGCARRAGPTGPLNYRFYESSLWGLGRAGTGTFSAGLLLKSNAMSQVDKLGVGANAV